VLAGNKIIAFVAPRIRREPRRFIKACSVCPWSRIPPFAPELDCGGTMLRIAKVSQLPAAPYTVLGWTVADIRNAIAALAGRRQIRGLSGDDPG
jgi:hypothetical protein